MVFPCFEINGSDIFLDIIPQVESAGFKIRRILPDWVINYPFIHLTGRNTIIYGNKEYLMKREIISMVKNE